MQPRLYLVFLFALLGAATARSHAEPVSAHTASTAHPMPGYRTQSGTHELPYRHAAPAGAAPTGRVAYWNEVALQTIAIDHVQPTGATGTFMPEQLGPTRTSRVMAIVQLAVHDALNAIRHRHPGYSGTLTALPGSSPDAAIAQAAHDTLAALYPRQATRLRNLLKADLGRLPAGRGTLDGADLGRRAAAAILALRAGDGSDADDPVVGVDYAVGNAPGRWRPDPVSRVPIALGAYWYRVRPFTLPSGSQFRPGPPPPLASEDYARDFNEVKRLGGDGDRTPTVRTPEQTAIGIYWAHDSTPWLGSPLRIFNFIAVQLALPRSADALALARTLALVNVAVADATIGVWDGKYTYVFWRPVTAIREASPSTGPLGTGDGNPATQADPTWTPLGAPASNLIGPNFTPPFPSYPSGHAGQSGAAFQILRRLYGDRIRFTFVSDEWNGITRDNDGDVRPRWPRTFQTLSQAEEEADRSRIYLGVHWAFDAAAGMALGRRTADYVFEHGLQPAAAQP